MKDWKTTAAGVATIVGALCAAALNIYHNQPLNFPVLGASITTGIGLIHASDSQK